MVRQCFTQMLFLVILASAAYAGTLTADSCSRADVNTAYSAATAGDTIYIPSGNCTWSNSITIAKKNLVITGAGASNTIITSNSTVFQFSGTSGNGARITGIQFKNSSASIYFSGTNSAKDWRIDNNKFVNDYGAIQTHGTTRGLVDHNTFSNSYAFYLFANGNSTVHYPLDVGDAMSPTTDTIFIEDNLFTDMGNCSNVPHSIVGNLAARAIIRYNTFDYESGNCGWADAVDAHDSLENWPNRGTLGYEIYENKFYMDSNNARTIHLRGGQHMVYNNYFNKNLSDPIKITSYLYGDTPGRCNGDIYDNDDSDPNSCPDQINHTYIWGNKDGCGSDMDTCVDGSDVTPAVGASAVLKLNTHYFLEEKNGYTGYTYPHPLQSNSIIDTIKPKSPGFLQVTK